MALNGAARGRLVNVRELKKRIADEAARGGIELPPVVGALEGVTERSAFAPSPLPPYKLQPDLHPRPDGYSMADYGAVNDEAFVVAAYMSVLGRLPDAIGLRQNLAAVRRGVPKALILGRLRYSREGRAVGARIRGLLPRVLLHLTQRIPLAGWLVGLALALLSPARASDRVNRIESLVAQLSEEVARQAAERGQIMSSDVARLAAEVSELRSATLGRAEITVLDGAPPDMDGLLALLEGASGPVVAFSHEVLTCRAIELLCGPEEATPARCAEVFRALLEQRGFARSELLEFGDRSLLLVARR
jgi:hypothetical protein